MFFYYCSIANNWDLEVSDPFLAYSGLIYWFVSIHFPKSWISVTPGFPLINYILKEADEKYNTLDTPILWQKKLTRKNGLFVLPQILKNLDFCD